MRKIWKFELKDSDNKICAPIKNFVSLQIQKNTICVWAEVDTNLPSENYEVTLFTTGAPIFEKANYIGTIMMFDDGFVLHGYWRKL